MSPSRAADFMTCPLLYRFRVIDRLPEPTDREHRGGYRGEHCGGEENRFEPRQPRRMTADLAIPGPAAVAVRAGALVAGRWPRSEPGPPTSGR